MNLEYMVQPPPHSRAFIDSDSKLSFWTTNKPMYPDMKLKKGEGSEGNLSSNLSMSHSPPGVVRQGCKNATGQS